MSNNKGKGKAQQGGNCMIILVGLPGSGKSTVATELQLFGFTRVNQDELGTADECKKAIAKALKHGEHVVLDRCNTMQKERKMFITETKREFENLKFIESCFLDPGIDVCKERVRERRNHPTLGPENADEVIDSFLKGFKEPEKWEGFTSMFTVRNSTDLKEFYDSIKERYPKPEKKGASTTGKPDTKKKK